jgi:hypothetical protein
MSDFGPPYFGATDTKAPCPFCGNPLEGLERYCWSCKRYVSEARTNGPASDPEPDALPDTRSEDERKADAREAVELLGWLVIDNEQGWRPFACPDCGRKLAGGTRTTLGLADWLCLKDGRAVFIEWKGATGRQSADQKAFQDSCDAAGIPYRVCRTTEQAVSFLEEVGNG